MMKMQTVHFYYATATTMMLNAPLNMFIFITDYSLVSSIEMRTSSLMGAGQRSHKITISWRTMRKNSRTTLLSCKNLAITITNCYSWIWMEPHTRYQKTAVSSKQKIHIKPLYIIKVQEKGLGDLLAINP